MGEGVLGLLFREAEKPGGYGGGCNFDKHGVVEPDLVEGVTDLETALDLVGFGERYENGTYCQGLLAVSQ